MAKGMNRFSGVALTPDSLSFMLRQRQWKMGEIARVEEQLKRLPKELALLREEVAALDTVIGMHPIKVDLSKVPAVRKNAPRLLPYGTLKRALLEALQRADGEPRSTIELALDIAQANYLETSKHRLNDLRVAVVKNLNYLLKDELVVQLPSKGGRGAVALWAIAPKN